MNPEFQQAIEMTRAGDKVGAQKTVANILKENPDDANAWYLLSLLVNSDQKRAVYLSKVVSLDPNHEKAIEQLTLLEQTATPAIPVSNGNDYDLMEQEKAETIPDWMAEDGAPTLQPELIGSTDREEQAAAEEQDPLPDWVQEDVSTSWIEEETAIVATPSTEVVEEKTPPPAKKKAPAKKKPAAKNKAAVQRKKKKQQLDMALYGLIILAVLVGILLLGYIVLS